MASESLGMVALAVGWCFQYAAIGFLFGAGFHVAGHLSQRLFK